MKLPIDDIVEYVENNISVFHEKRVAKIATLKLKEVLKKKNPYLFKAKYMQTVEEIIKDLLNAYVSSSEETMFGDWLEGLAIFINQKVYSGRKSGIKRNENYLEKYVQLINRFTKEFIESFCDTAGKIDWNELVKFNSERTILGGRYN